MTDTKELTTKEKARLMRNKRQREWAKKNPDKIRAYQEKYYSKKYDEMIEQIVEDFKQDHEVSDNDDDTLKAIADSYTRHDVNLDLERGDLRE